MTRARVDEQAEALQVREMPPVSTEKMGSRFAHPLGATSGRSGRSGPTLAAPATSRHTRASSLSLQSSRAAPRVAWCSTPSSGREPRASSLVLTDGTASGIELSSDSAEMARQRLLAGETMPGTATSAT
jgi:hypothetical protein